MSGGAISLGMIGGLTTGAMGSILGASAAIVLSSVYLVIFLANSDPYLKAATAPVLNKLRLMTPFIVALGTTLALENSGVFDGELLIRVSAYAGSIIVTCIAILIFGDVRGIINTTVDLD